MPDTPITLSPRGQARRDEMLASLTGVLRDHHRRRRRRRTVAAMSSFATVIATLGIVSTHAPPRAETTAPLMAVAPPPPPSRVICVRTEDGATARITADPATRIVRLDDASLLDLLVAMDRPAGLVRDRGGVRLTHSVVDEPSS